MRDNTKKLLAWLASQWKTETITNAYDAILHIVDFIVSRTSDSLAGILIKALPLLAPVPNAVSVWRISQHAPLNYDALQAGALAASVEGMFFALTEVVLNMFDGYLQDKERYKYPLGIAVSILVLFFILVEIIVLGIETNPIACAFPVISLIAAVALGCARWHKRGANILPARKQPTTQARKQTEVAPANMQVTPVIETKVVPQVLAAKSLDEIDARIIDAVTQGASTPYAISKVVGIAQTTLKRKSAEGIYVGRLPALVDAKCLLNGGTTYSIPD
jgi:hypothetical protein